MVAADSAAETPDTPPQKNSKKRLVAAVIACILVLVGAVSGWYFTLGPGGRVAIPNVEGKTAAQAKSMLVKAELKVKISREYSDTIAPNKATRTDPKAGGKAWKKSQVNLYISRGIEYVKFPI